MDHQDLVFFGKAIPYAVKRIIAHTRSSFHESGETLCLALFSADSRDARRLWTQETSTMISRDWIALNTTHESADDGRPMNIAAGTLDERREFGGWITLRLFESAIWNETHRPSHFLACIFAQAY